MLDYGDLSCFVSHKCNDETHALIERLRAALRQWRVNVLRDPFQTGHEIITRVHTLSFHSFLFLHSPESWESTICQEELETAKNRFVPLLTARMSGNVPEPLRK